MTIEFQDNSKKAKAEIAKVSQKGMEAALLMLEASIKAGAPVSSGHLRDHIDHKTTVSGTKVTGQVGSPDMYAVYVEYGTGEFAENGSGRKGGWNYQDPSGEWFFTWGQEPQKFMRNGFRQNKNKVKEVLGKEYGASFKGGKGK